MKFIVTDTRTAGNDLQRRIFAKHLRRRARNGRLIRDSDKVEVGITGLTNAQLNADFILYGRQKLRITFTKGRTVRWAIPRQRLDGKWIIKYHTDVDSIVTSVRYTVEEFDPSWFNQTGLIKP